MLSLPEAPPWAASRGRPSPFSETQIVSLHHASRDVCAPRWLPSGNGTMTEREGGRKRRGWEWGEGGEEGPSLVLMLSLAVSQQEGHIAYCSLSLLTCEMGILLLTP